MISHEDVPQYVCREIPGFRQQLDQPSRNSNSVYHVMHTLVDYTNEQLKKQDYKGVEQCFLLVDRLYTTGNNLIRCAVENVFVYALDRTLMAFKCNKQKVRSLLPPLLYQVYVEQMVSSNI